MWRKLKIVSVLIGYLLIPGTLYPQDLRKQAIEILSTSENSRINWQSCRFDIVREDRGLIILENAKPPAFVIFQQVDSGFAVIGYSATNRFFQPDTDLALANEWLGALEMATPGYKTGTTGITNLPLKVTPMVSARWSQDERFSWACPSEPKAKDGHAYPGCVAVAMGQILHFYKHFNHFNTSTTFTHPVYGLQSASLGDFNWQRMENDPVCVDKEISRLLYSLGVLVHMDFGYQSSSASTHMALQAFHQLGYEDALIYRRNEMTPQSWMQVITDNLRLNHPIMVTGGGHAFVCDGLDENGFLHFNMGGGGYGDGYYAQNMAFGYPVNELITDLCPADYPSLDIEVLLKRSGQENAEFGISLRDGQSFDNRFSVYIDGNYTMDVSDTLFTIENLSPGKHHIQITSYLNGRETTWTTPCQFFIYGHLVHFIDGNLEAVIRKALAYGSSEVEQNDYLTGTLAEIRELVIDNPVSDLSGLEFCTGLRTLIINQNAGSELDLSVLSGLKNVRILVLDGIKGLNINKENEINLLTILSVGHTDSLTLSWIHHPAELLELSCVDINSFNEELIQGFTGLEKLTISDIPLGSCRFLQEMNHLRYLNLSGANISDLEAIAWPQMLESLILENNVIEDMAGIQELRHLKNLDISSNQLKEIKLFDPYQSLESLDASDNQVESILISADMPKLSRVNLARNHLVTPGRLFLYTPGLKWLDLSNNMLEDLSPYRAPVLEDLIVSANRLSTLNGIYAHPEIKRLDVSYNQVSDFTPLLNEVDYHHFNEIDLRGNPVSEQSFKEVLPELNKRVINLKIPDRFEPLSPCYVIPGPGNVMAGESVAFAWYCRGKNEGLVFEWRIFREDSLSEVVTGIEHPWLMWEVNEGDRFEWQVGSRLGDTVFWSGRYPVKALDAFSLPFFEDFESYPNNRNWNGLSPYWGVGGYRNYNNSVYPVTDAAVARSGIQSLRLDHMATTTLDMSHLNESVITLKFSVWIPAHRSGSWRLNMKDGLSLSAVITETNEGKLYFNDRLCTTFQLDHAQWLDWRIVMNGQNNRIFVVLNNRTILNQIWIFNDGKVQPEDLIVSSTVTGEGDEDHPCLVYLDDVMITLPSGVTDVEVTEKNPEIRVWPNPVMDQLNIDIGDLNGEGWVRVFTADGRLVSEIRLKENQQLLQLDSSRWIKGAYLVHFDLDGQSTFKKVVK